MTMDNLKSRLAEMKADTEKMLEEMKRGSYSKAFFEGHLDAINEILALTQTDDVNLEGAYE